MRSILGPLFLVGFAFGQPRPAEKCILSGVVQDALSGVPLNKVQVIASLTAGQAFYTTSDKTGAFTIVDLPAGGYHLTARRNGYLEGESTSITLEAGQEIKDLKYKLTPFGVIAGTVRDQDGEALTDVSVAAYRVRYNEGRRRLSGGDEIKTDDLGQYRITGLAPGRYYVVATPDEHSSPGRLREVTLAALYPGVADPASARQVEVAAGARVTESISRCLGVLS